MIAVRIAGWMALAALQVALTARMVRTLEEILIAHLEMLEEDELFIHIDVDELADLTGSADCAYQLVGK
jgi:hypothetical protein